MFEGLMLRDPTARPKKFTVSKRMIKGISIAEVANPWNLSPMEFEVMRQLHEYITQAEVARTLGVSKKSVSTYTVRAKTKMDRDTMTEALQLFRRFMRGDDTVYVS